VSDVGVALIIVVTGTVVVGTVVLATVVGGDVVTVVMEAQYGSYPAFFWHLVPLGQVCCLPLHKQFDNMQLVGCV
jgi:hypothetical protein